MTSCSGYFVEFDMEKLHAKMRKEGITQQELADVIGVTRRSFCGWKKKGKIPAPAFLKICYLFGWLDVPNEFNMRLTDERVM